MRAIITSEAMATFPDKGLPEEYKKLVSNHAKTAHPDYILAKYVMIVTLIPLSSTKSQAPKQ